MAMATVFMLACIALTGYLLWAVLDWLTSR